MKTLFSNWSALRTKRFAFSNIFQHRVDAVGWNCSSRETRILPHREQGPINPTYGSQYHGCWWPGDGRSQTISSHGIDLVLEYSGISTRTNEISDGNNMMMPSHYLNQNWFIVNWSHRNKSQWNLIQNIRNFFKEMHLKMLSAKRQPFCSGLNFVKLITFKPYCLGNGIFHYILQMGWLLALPGHQQTWYWFNLHKIYHCLHRKVLNPMVIMHMSLIFITFSQTRKKIWKCWSCEIRI